MPQTQVHDRRADKPFNAEVKPVLIDDPFGPGAMKRSGYREEVQPTAPPVWNERGELTPVPPAKIVATRSLRSDPLGRLYAHGDIDEVLYVAGRKFQVLYAAAEISTASGSQWRERVQGGSIAEVLTEHRQKAMRELAKLYKRLGPEKSMVMMAILGERMWFSDLSAITGTGARKVSEKLKEALSITAQALGHLAKAA